jgi:hypothetical protein
MTLDLLELGGDGAFFSPGCSRTMGSSKHIKIVWAPVAIDPGLLYVLRDFYEGIYYIGGEIVTYNVDK